MPLPDSATAESPLRAAIFAGASHLFLSCTDLPGWSDVLVRGAAPTSQYDLLIDHVRAGASVPDRVVCLAGEGSGFHGFRGRSWVALPGNVHAAVSLAPGRRIERFETAFTALAAVSLADAVHSVPDLAARARIKWVNDILVDGAKVGGVLAYTRSQHDRVDAVVLGFGLNVEARPAVDRSPFVPTAGALRDFVGGGSTLRTDRIVTALLASLQRNYAMLLEHGYPAVMDRYRALSAVLGQEVTVCSEPGAEPARIIARGRVHAVGDGLELHLAGNSTPVRKGRLMLGTVAPEAIS